jgi:XTP/dITP diphosphohydrolase
MRFIFASNNPNKLAEVQAIIPQHEIICLDDLNIHESIPEDYDTLHENAMQKAKYIYNLTQDNVFADDTGLFVDALNGSPGVFSARYAGENCSFKDNMQKVLRELEGQSNRKAAFVTVVACILHGKEYFFEGRIEGYITEDIQGEKGFGYDPIFLPNGYNQTFAMMPAETKNAISHRWIALQKLANFLTH